MIAKTTSHKILHLLKTQGQCTSKFLAEQLHLTSMGARKQLLKLSDQEMITSFLKSSGVGRPNRYWYLTEKSRQQFPDRHSNLTLQLIDSIKTIFGDESLSQLIEYREHQAQLKYAKQLLNVDSILNKLMIIAKLRSEDGYMAEVQTLGDYYLLIENHCPICAAAKKCQNFCRTELNMFQQLLAKDARVERIEHLLNGARRCAYKVSPLSP